MAATGCKLTLTCLFALLMPVTLRAAEPAEAELPVVAEDNFDKDAEQWEFLDPESWQYKTVDGESFLCQSVRSSKYAPPHRSPLHVALLKDHVVSDMELTVSVRSTVEDYPHRDACLFFNYVDSAHFYYVHIGKLGDPHCNQIFIVNGADRKAISKTTTEGTNWTDDWHRVKIVRTPATGAIEIYFDDLETPAMTAEDKTFTAGRVGVGTFDDTTDWDNFELRGTPAKLAEAAE